MQTALPLAGFGFALGWPLELLIQRFPSGEGTAPSSRRRWIVAALTALLFAALALRIGFHPRLVPALLLTALVVPASVIDIEHRIIPNAINLPGAVAVFATAVAAQPDRWWEFLAGGLGAALFLGLAWIVYPKGMGAGDVKLALMTGLGVGKFAVIALFAGFALSLVPSVVLLITQGVRGRKATFPFGPFLAAGAVVALLWGPQLWSLWLSGHA
jgi:leader peptidase (prepilin peptidase) / N-methyltransferase